MSYLKLMLEALEAQDTDLLKYVYSLMEMKNARTRRYGRYPVRIGITGLLALSPHGRNSVSEVSHQNRSSEQGQTRPDGSASSGLLDSDRSEGCEPRQG